MRAHKLLLLLTLSLFAVPAAAQFTGTPGDTTIVTGGTAQVLFNSQVPLNGWAVYNPNSVDDVWCSDSTTAVANGTGSIRIVANGGGYETPPTYKPATTVSCVAATTGDKITARRW